METKLAKKLTQHLVNNKIINAEYEDCYIYGLELIFSFFSTFFIIITLGLIFQHCIIVSTFLITFISLRQFTGGYHASTYIKCKIITVIIYICVQLFTSLFYISAWMFLPLLAIGEFLILRYAPLESPYKPLTENNKKINRTRAAIIFLLYCIFGILLQNNILEMSNTIYFTLISVLVLMLIAILQKGERINEKT